jgi:hypothetical protein
MMEEGTPVKRIGIHWGGLSSAIVEVAFVTALLHLVTLVIFPSGYDIKIGGLSLHVGHFRMTLAVCFTLAMARALLRSVRDGGAPLRDLRSPLILFLACLMIYSLSSPAVWSSDTVPTRYLPISIITDWDLDLDEFSFQAHQGYALKQAGGHVVSAYPPWGGVLAVPMYLMPILRGETEESLPLLDLEKRSAALITTLSVLVLYFTARRLTHERWAWLMALIFAFGTTSFSVSSQALWQHGPSQLFVALTLYCLVRGLKEPWLSGLAGLPLGLAFICRPLNLMLALPIAVYILHARRKEFWAFCAAALPPFVLFSTYNWFYFGSPFTTGFSGTVVSPSSMVSQHWTWFQTPILTGAAGVLFSPGRGLLVYSPILVFSFIGIAMAWKERGYLLFKYLGVAAMLMMLPIARLGHWWGGHGYGPRLLADMAPILALFLVLPFERHQATPLRKFMIAVLFGLSIGLHALGIVSDKTWNAYPNDVDQHPERLWSWLDSPPVYYGKQVFDRLASRFL